MVSASAGCPGEESPANQRELASSAAGSSGNDDGSPAAETKGDDDGSPAAAAAESAAQTKGDDDGNPAAAAAEAQTKGDDDGSPAGGAAVAPSAADGAAPPAGQKALPVEVKVGKAVETPSVEGLLCIDFDEDDEAEASAAAVPPSDLPQSAAIVAAAPSDSDLVALDRGVEIDSGIHITQRAQEDVGADRPGTPP